ncbi:UDP-glycosyltransferase 82A1 [Humulus lupulus]|uniref:UDP-glycosyltransferase 82A1 n=1 Tax=Humulus lupulus TaxID=3486 RepID=UPI002B4080C2|nr:UDP-glycosyltransferase 82A1 [Humulus lupulus]XP_062107038.1 UDP-glycosyltransferase 82A1 [Humulus lupulus]
MKNYCSKGSSKIIVFVPYPAQGHVTPMLKLATAFLKLDQGLRPVFVTPRFIHDQIISRQRFTNDHQTNSIEFVPIPDGIDESVPRDFFSLEAAMEKVMPAHLERLVRDQGGGVVVCMMVDLLASWAIEVANRCGVRVAGFWPAMLATYRLIVAIPDMVRSGLISDTGSPQHLGPVRSLPNQPMLSTEELPWLIGTVAARKARFKFWTRTLARSRTLKLVLANSIPDEEPLNDEKPNQELPVVLPIGPLCKNSTTKNPSFWEEDNSCLDWLDKQKPNSVIYISFGSWVSPIGESKVRTLAMALESLGHFFIWVLGNSWTAGLPVGFEERISNRGKIVSWAPQMEVLKHRAVGFYLTHCGWNSTMEAIQSQKRLLCYPIAGDQFVNCNYIVKVWRIGVRINGVGLKDVEEGLRKIVEDKEMGMRLKKMYERTMGDEACNRATSNLRSIGDFLGKQTLLGSSFVNETSF